MDVTLFILPLLAIFIYIMAIVLHELGHLTCGLLTGYKFHKFQIGWLVWHKEGNRIKFKLTRALSIFSAGQSTMIPPKEYKDLQVN